MDDDKIKLIVQVIGGLLGLIAFMWNLLGYIWTYILSHLQIEISNEKVKVAGEEQLKVTVIVENKGSLAKKVNFAFLLISPDHVSFKEALLQLAKHSGFEGSHVEVLGLLRHCIAAEEQLKRRGVIDESHLMNALPFFFDEHLQIGNEKVKHACVLPLKDFCKNKVYNIRFITISKHLFGSYLRYRSTSDVFIN